MSVGVTNDTSHAHLRCALDQAISDQAIRVGNPVQSTGDGKHTIMHAWHDLADTSADSSLVAQVCDVLAGLADNDTSFLGGDNGTERELSLTIFLFGARSLFGVEGAHLVGQVVNAGVDDGRGIFSRHVEGGRR